MLLEALRIKGNTTGIISIYDADTRELLYQRHNAIQPFSIEIVAKLLAGLTTHVPNEITVWLASVNIATQGTLTKTNPASDKVKYEAYFDGASFTGPLDELRLSVSTLGELAIATGLSYTKTTPIIISWEITIS